MNFRGRAGEEANYLLSSDLKDTELQAPHFQVDQSVACWRMRTAEIERR